MRGVTNSKSDTAGKLEIIRLWVEQHREAVDEFGAEKMMSAKEYTAFTMVEFLLRVLDKGH